MRDRPGNAAGDTATNNVVSGAARNVVQAKVIEGGVHFHQSGRPAVGLPYRVGSFPPRAAAFQDRDAAGVLAGVLASGDSAALAPDSVVVSGLGGVGKTQVALDYAERMWTSGTAELVVWVTASSREAITFSFARLAGELTGLEDPNPDLGAQRLLEWLAVASARWLVVLDDLQRPGDLRGLWPPTTSTGQTVVTTRRQDAALRGRGRRMVEMEVFTPAEALAYLQAALGDQAELLAGATELAAAVGYLPLALAQAAAYLLDRGLSCAEYLQRLADRRRRLASLVPEPEALPDEHADTVAATWSLSLQHANRLQPQGLAGPLLEIASLLDANGIPLEVFTTPAVTHLLTSTLRREVGQEEARDGLRCLQRLSLINLDASSVSQQVRIHALVQRVTRDTLTPEHLAVVARVADTLRHVWPNVDTSVGPVLRANAGALAETGGEHLWQPDGHEVLFRAGKSLGQAGLAAQARDYFHRLHTTAHTHLGPDQPDTLTTRHEIAIWRGESGEPAAAVTALEQVLADEMRVLGPDHPEILTTRHNLAYWRGRAGDAAAAAAAFEELLPEVLRVLGPDHPDTLNIRQELAGWRGQSGDAAGAAAALEQLLPDFLRVLGPDHRDTLIVRHELADWRGKSGDAAEAAAAFDELLADRLQLLGPDHPHTLTTRRDLAYWRGESGKPAGAVTALEQVLADQLRVLGPDHPEILTTRHELARWRGRAGDAAAAAAAFEELLPEVLSVLGPHHPDTLLARYNLAHWHGHAGDPAGAATALNELLPTFLRLLGADHPYTLTIRNSLAYWSKRQSDDTP